MRGEQIVDITAESSDQGSAPLARGTGPAIGAYGLWARISPACAGNRNNTGSFFYVYEDQPRLRGEQLEHKKRRLEAEGSAPLARGTASFSRIDNAGARISPACAGNRSMHDPRIIRIWDQPRLRGEQASAAALSGSLMGSAPLARGTVFESKKVGVVGRISPACAGNSIFRR